MNTKRDAQHPVATALRQAGFLPLPRLWVKPEDIPKIHKIAHTHADKVNEIRKNATQADPDPTEDKDAAWEAYEQSRGVK